MQFLTEGRCELSEFLRLNFNPKLMKRSFLSLLPIFISLLSFSASVQTTISDIKMTEVISDSDAPDTEILTGS